MADIRSNRIAPPPSAGPYGGGPGYNYSYPPPGQIQYIQQQPYYEAGVKPIRDWLPWSIVNIIIGWIVLAILPLICSLICRSRKKQNNTQGAQTMSTLALIFNILATILGIAAWIALIVALVLLNNVVHTADSIANAYNGFLG